MKRIGYYVVAMLMLLLFCSGCGKEEIEKKFSFNEFKTEINAELDEIKNGKYENLNLACNNVRLPESEQLKVVKFLVESPLENMSLKEKLELYRDVIYPKVLDIENIDTSCFLIEMNKLNSSDDEKLDYEYVLENAEKLESNENVRISIRYKDYEAYHSVEDTPEGICFNLSQGKLGKLNGGISPFAAIDYELVNVYNCYADDMSDSYPLMDGTQKTVAEAKAEIEAYLDMNYPVIGEKNDICNEVYKIKVGKIPNTEYYVFDAYRTFSYEGVRVKEYKETGREDESGIMAQAFLCESNKVDVLLGVVNFFDKGEVVKEYHEYIPFAEVVEKVSLYVTGKTVFNICQMGLEYRIFTETTDEKFYYNWVPYWAFYLENPNSGNVIRVYVDIETGEVESF